MSPGIVANVALLAVLAGWLARRATPATEAVRLRNAFLVEPGSAADFDWPPDRPPRGYLREKRAPDPKFVAIVDELAVNAVSDDWTRALRLASHLVRNAKDKGPIRADLHTTYRLIGEGYGYCADFVRVFIALAHAARLGVRQWGFTFDGFGGHGHTIVEVYDRQRRKWLMLDVYNNFHAVDSATAEPLGALEYRAALLGERGPATMHPNGPGRPGFVHAEKAVDYYRRGIDQWYLVWGNAVYTYHEQPLVRVAGRLSRAFADFAANTLGVLPRMRVYATDRNADPIRRIGELRRKLTFAAALAGALAVVLAIQIRFELAS